MILEWYIIYIHISGIYTYIVLTSLRVCNGGMVFRDHDSGYGGILNVWMVWVFICIHIYIFTYVHRYRYLTHVYSMCMRLSSIFLGPQIPRSPNQEFAVYLSGSGSGSGSVRWNLIVQYSTVQYNTEIAVYRDHIHFVSEES